MKTFPIFTVITSLFCFFSLTTVSGTKGPTVLATLNHLVYANVLDHQAPFSKIQPRLPPDSKATEAQYNKAIQSLTNLKEPKYRKAIEKGIRRVLIDLGTKCKKLKVSSKELEEEVKALHRKDMTCAKGKRPDILDKLGVCVPKDGKLKKGQKSAWECSKTVLGSLKMLKERVRSIFLEASTDRAAVDEYYKAVDGETPPTPTPTTPEPEPEPEPTPNSQDNDKKDNTWKYVIGVIVALIVVSGAGTGGFFFWRNQQKQQRKVIGGRAARSNSNLSTSAASDSEAIDVA